MAVGWEGSGSEREYGVSRLGGLERERSKGRFLVERIMHEIIYETAATVRKWRRRRRRPTGGACRLFSRCTCASVFNGVIDDFFFSFLFLYFVSFYLCFFFLTDPLSAITHTGVSFLVASSTEKPGCTTLVRHCSPTLTAFATFEKTSFNHRRRRRRRIIADHL